MKPQREHRRRGARPQWVLKGAGTLGLLSLAGGCSLEIDRVLNDTPHHANAQTAPPDTAPASDAQPLDAAPLDAAPLDAQPLDAAPAHDLAPPPEDSAGHSQEDAGAIQDAQAPTRTDAEPPAPDRSCAALAQELQACGLAQDHCPGWAQSERPEVIFDTLVAQCAQRETVFRALSTEAAGQCETLMRGYLELDDAHLAFCREPDHLGCGLIVPVLLACGQSLPEVLRAPHCLGWADPDGVGERLQQLQALCQQFEAPLLAHFSAHIDPALDEAALAQCPALIQALLDDPQPVGAAFRDQCLQLQPPRYCPGTSRPIHDARGAIRDCLWVSPTAQGWAQAQAACAEGATPAAEGPRYPGQLAVLHNAQTLAEVRDAVMNLPSYTSPGHRTAEGDWVPRLVSRSDYWVGASRDNGDLHSWRWVDGAPLATDDPLWLEGEPNDSSWPGMPSHGRPGHAEEACTMLRDPGQLNDAECRYLLRFVCVFEAPLAFQ